MDFAYKGILQILLHLPKPLENFLFVLIYPIYQILHRNRAWGRVQRHLELTHLETQTSPRKIFFALYKNYLQSLRYLCHMPKALQCVQFENEEIIREPLENGIPVVATGIHQGAFEMMHRVLTRYSAHVYLFTHSFPSQALTRLLHQIRKTPGLEERETESVAKTLREFLKNKGILAMLIDQATEVRGTPVEILHRPAELFLRLPLKAMEMGACIVTFRTFYENGKHIICFEKFYPPKSNSENVSAQIADDISHWISEHPSQWTWNYHRNFTRGIEK